MVLWKAGLNPVLLSLTDIRHYSDGYFPTFTTLRLSKMSSISIQFFL